MPALSEYIKGRFGGDFFTQLTSVTVTNAATKLVDHNFERMALVMINSGSTNAQVLPGSTVSTTNGITLNANGGALGETADSDLVLPGWEHYGITASGTTTLTIFEIIRYAPKQPAGG